MGKIVAVILAAGIGKRMNSDTPKQFIELCGKPIIYYTIKAFEDSLVDEIVLVTSKNDVEYCKNEIIKKYGFLKVIGIVEGGSERYYSVQNGLNYISECEYVLIHDGARPFVSEEVISNSIKEVKSNKACVVGVPTKDTVKICDNNNYVVNTLDRRSVWIVQTPQVFKYSMIKEAYFEILNKDTNGITDDAMVWETYYKDIPVKMIAGDYKNIKITTPEDLLIAEKYLEKND